MKRPSAPLKRPAAVLKKPSLKDVEIEPPVATPEKQARRLSKASANSSSPVLKDDQEIGEEEEMEDDPPLEKATSAKPAEPERSLPVLKKPSAAELHEPEETKPVLKKPSAAESKTSAKRGKAQFVTCEKHGGWTFYVYRRSTNGTPFNKYVAPDGKIYWTNQGAIAAGFKRMEPQ